MKQWQYLIKRPHLKACHNLEQWIKSGNHLKQPQHLRPRRGRFLQAAFSHCLISCSALLIHKETFQQCGGFDESFEVCEDFAFFLHFLKDYPIGLVNEKLTIKRAGNWPQLSKKYHSLDALRVLAILKFLEAHGSTLKQQEWEAGIAAMKNKITILNKGAARRRKKDEFTTLEKKIATVIKKEKNFQSTNTNPKNHYPV